MLPPCGRRARTASLGLENITLVPNAETMDNSWIITTATRQYNENEKQTRPGSLNEAEFGQSERNVQSVEPLRRYTPDVHIA